MWHSLQSADSKTIVGVLMRTTAASQTSIEADDILALARQRLATFKCPSSVDLVAELPRAVYLEYRCRSAWHIESLSGGVTLDESVATTLQAFQAQSGGGFPGLWAALGRSECELDPAVLD